MPIKFWSIVYILFFWSTLNEFLMTRMKNKMDKGINQYQVMRSIVDGPYEVRKPREIYQNYKSRKYKINNAALYFLLAAILYRVYCKVRDRSQATVAYVINIPPEVINNMPAPLLLNFQFVNNAAPAANNNQNVNQAVPLNFIGIIGDNNNAQGMNNLHPPVLINHLDFQFVNNPEPGENNNQNANEEAPLNFHFIETEPAPELVNNNMLHLVLEDPSNLQFANNPAPADNNIQHDNEDAPLNLHLQEPNVQEISNLHSDLFDPLNLQFANNPAPDDNDIQNVIDEAPLNLIESNEVNNNDQAISILYSLTMDDPFNFQFENNSDVPVDNNIENVDEEFNFLEPDEDNSNDQQVNMLHPIMVDPLISQLAQADNNHQLLIEEFPLNNLEVEAENNNVEELPEQMLILNGQGDQEDDVFENFFAPWLFIEYP